MMHLSKTNGKFTPSLPTIKYFKSEFKRSRTSIFDKDRSGPSERIVRLLRLDISTEWVQNILRTHLDMKELSTR